MRIKKKVAEFAGQVKLFHQFIFNHPGGTLPHAQPQSIVSDEVAHDLFGWRTLCSVKTVCWDVTDHLCKVIKEEYIESDCKNQ